MESENNTYSWLSNTAAMTKSPSPEINNFKPVVKELQAISKTIYAKDKFPPVCPYCGRQMSI